MKVNEFLQVMITGITYSPCGRLFSHDNIICQASLKL